MSESSCNSGLMSLVDLQDRVDFANELHANG